MIPVSILPQPDDTTCGPTSLHAVYRYYQDPIGLQEVIQQVPDLENGGTLGVFLADHALRRGYKTKIYTYNLFLFDPTWKELTNHKLVGKLREQLLYKQGDKLRQASEAYIEYLQLGGRVMFENLTRSLLKKYFKKGVPLLTGLSATYLYNNCREMSDENLKSVFHDVKGEPMGHFVVLCGFADGNKKVIVADPWKENPISGDHIYTVSTSRLMNAIMLGIITYDANILVIEPKEEGQL